MSKYDTTKLGLLKKTYDENQIVKKSENFNFQKTTKELESRIADLESSLGAALNELDSLKNGRKNLLSPQEVNRMISMIPVQRSVSIPVRVDEGGTGSTELGTAVQNLGITTRSITASGSATKDDQLILVDATSGNITVTLTTAASSYKKTIRVKKTDSSANTVIIAGSGSETIDGSANYTIINQYDTEAFVCDGSNWWRI